MYVIETWIKFATEFNASRNDIGQGQKSKNRNVPKISYHFGRIGGRFWTLSLTGNFFFFFANTSFANYCQFILCYMPISYHEPSNVLIISLRRPSTSYTMSSINLSDDSNCIRNKMPTVFKVEKKIIEMKCGYDFFCDDQENVFIEK